MGKLKHATAYSLIRGMRHLRVLKQDVWYEIRTAINNREPLFRLRQALALFGRVLNETQQRFSFELAGLRLEDEWLTFYIRPADGLGLPDIMKWLKQTFAVRYNVLTGRIGHIWGDRYWSLILEGEPPVGEEGEDEAPVTVRVTGVGGRPLHEKIPHITGFSLIFPYFLITPPP
jgi:REP element-mobilizing transposase RayT